MAQPFSIMTTGRGQCPGSVQTCEVSSTQVSVVRSPEQSDECLRVWGLAVYMTGSEETDRLNVEPRKGD